MNPNALGKDTIDFISTGYTSHEMFFRTPSLQLEFLFSNEKPSSSFVRVFLVKATEMDYQDTLANQENPCKINDLMVHSSKDLINDVIA